MTKLNLRIILIYVFVIFRLDFSPALVITKVFLVANKRLLR